jgi:hypothetical protein
MITQKNKNLHLYLSKTKAGQICPAFFVSSIAVTTKIMKIIFPIVLLSVILNISGLNAQKRFVKLSAADTIPKLELDSFYKYMANTIKYPRAVIEDQIKGVVMATYYIDANNKIKNIKILRSIDTLLSIEVIKALQGSSPPSIKKQGIVYVLPVY